MRTWRTLGDGTVEVDDGAGFAAPVLPGPNASTDRVLALVSGVLAPVAAAHGIPLPWVCAIAYRESGGRPDAIGDNGAGKAKDYGLMQINGSNFKAFGLNDSNWMDPRENARAACELLALILKRDPARISNLPVVLAVYGAGGDPKTGEPWPSESSPWGMRETKGSIDAGVAANNWFVAHLPSGAPRQPGDGAPGGTPAIEPRAKKAGGGGLALAALLGVGWYLWGGRG